MKNLSLKITPSLLGIIAGIERGSGVWDRLSLAEAFDESEALQEGALAAFALEGTPPGTGSTSDDEGAEKFVSAYLGAFDHHFEMTPAGIIRLFAEISPDTGLGSVFRKSQLEFHVPAPGQERDLFVFSTVQPYLVEQRLSEIAGWTGDVLRSRALHPVLAAGIFHLAFLQLSPFPFANHRLATMITWQILANSGFPFVRHRHFAPEFLAQVERYAAALKQAEKTCFSSWATLNSWLEFFVQIQLKCVESLVEEVTSRSRDQQLNSTQRMIIEVIRDRGIASREAIASASGINVSTVKYNLAVLSRRGLLAREGGGRTTTYKLI